MRVPGVAAGPIRPVPDDGNQVRGLVPNRTAGTLTGTTGHDQTAVERVPGGPRQQRLGDVGGAAREGGNDLTPHFCGDFVGRAVAGRLALPNSSTQVAGGGIEIADVDREHRDVAIAIQNRSASPTGRAG